MIFLLPLTDANLRAFPISVSAAFKSPKSTNTLAFNKYAREKDESIAKALSISESVFSYASSLKCF